MNVLLTKLDRTTLASAKIGQHREGILLQGTIAANSSDTIKVEVGTAGTICTMRMAGQFTTLDVDAGSGHIIDDGVCHLRGQLIDTDKNLQLFNDFVPFTLFCSPGRVKAKSTIPGSAIANVTNYLVDDGIIAKVAAAGGNLYEPNEFTHPFPVNSYIRMDVKNDAAAANSFAIYFDCIRVTRKGPKD